MIVTRNDHIPDKIIVSVLGNIEIKQRGSYKRNKGKGPDLLVEKAKEMGANAITNYLVVDRLGVWNNKNSYYSGLAVIVEEIGEYWRGQKCSNCGKPIKITSNFCGKCGSKQ